MHEFFIQSSSGPGGLLFYNREPFEPERPIEEFWICVTDVNLSADAIVNTYTSYPLQKLFADIARQATGWTGELTWESLEGELRLSCTNDGRGHISIRIALRSGWTPNAWEISAIIETELGLLEDIARRAAIFFGNY